MAAHGRKTVAAILVAGGAGVRLGAEVPKAFCLVKGRTLLEHALMPFRGVVPQLVVVAPAAALELTRTLVGADVTVVAGGATRQQSVRCGLAAVEAELVLRGPTRSSRPVPSSTRSRPWRRTVRLVRP
jgi:2-C-methyl-D-erythritol 4-phosphate cytidylyltransferase